MTDEQVLIRFLEELSEEFWTAHPNSNVLAGALGRKWGSTLPASSWLSRANQFLTTIKPNANAYKRLQLQVVAGALEVANLSLVQMGSLIRQCTPDEAKLLIEAYVATSSYSSPQNALNDLLQVWQNGGHEASQPERRFLASIALRYHVSQLKSADELLRYLELTAGGADFDSLLLKEVATFHPAIFESYLTAFVNKDPKKVAAQARHSMIPADKLKMLLQGMGDKKYEFLKEYLVALAVDSPQAAAALANIFSANELPLDCRALVVQAIHSVGEVDLGKWLASLAENERAKTLDAIDYDGWQRVKKTGMQLDFSRSYLRHRLTLPDADSIKSGHPARGHLGEAIMIFARSNLEEALSLLGLLPPETREELIALAYHNRAHRLRFAKQMEDCYALIERAPPTLVPELLAESLPWVQDMESAVAAMERFQLSDEARAKIMDSLLSSELIQVDLERRQDALLECIKAAPNNPPTTAIEFVLGEHVMKNPSLGADWISRMPPGPAREYAIPFYATKWAHFDPAGASEWIASLPASPERDRAAKELVSASIDDLEIAFANAVAISNPALQFEAASQVIRTWRKIDPRVAFDYLENSSLPKDVVQRLQATVPSSFLSIQ